MTASASTARRWNGHGAQARDCFGGSDLTALAPLPPREACRVVRDIASALALAHARRLLYRDISPSNVRLSADGRAKLLDFGALAPFGRLGPPAKDHQRG